ncbi:VHS domain-containing [Cordyceps militaris]|uniref:VHS domain-containing n=1 Tax=Cordyceps militaris TaxID=73501 RepID=A0A2H4STN6_CORMI|nr:VHS domain-containing [Cordyceps militaris]
MFQTKKPYSAVTATIENLTTEDFAEDDLSGIVELIEAISLQPGGPTEAARAIRKKLKYGSPHRQLRALALLDGLMENAGPRFQRSFADEPLLERLRVCGAPATTTDDQAAVRDKCRELFAQWRRYAGTPGMEKIARLHKETPRRKVPVTQEQSKVIRETEANPFGDDEEEEATRRAAAAAAAASSPSESSSHKHTRTASLGGGGGFFSSSRSSKDSTAGRKKSGGGKRGGRRFNLEAEKEQIYAVIADASLASAELLQGLQSVDRERERVSANQATVQRFEACKQLRRRVLRYIPNVVGHEALLKSLLAANDMLVHALMTFEQLDHSIDADSDSDDEIAEQAHLYHMVSGHKGNDPTTHDLPAAVDRLTVNKPDATTARTPPPPRPPAISPKAPRRPPVVAPGDDLESASEDEDEDDDPFGDSHVVGTPAAVERHEPRW